LSSRWVLGRAVEVGAITGAHGSVSSYLAGKSGLGSLRALEVGQVWVLWALEVLSRSIPVVSLWVAFLFAI